MTTLFSGKTLSALSLFGVMLISFSVASSAHAAAHCWSNVICSFPDGSSLEKQTSEGKRPNGKNFNYPFSNSEWTECRDYTNAYALSLDLEQVARDRNTCGTVECSSKYWLGTRPTREAEIRSVQVECLPSEENTQSQYSTKLICGTQAQDSSNNELVAPGLYKTVVNVHNPHDVAVDFRRKVALGGPANDGTISVFEFGQIGPDGVQYFDCAYMRRLSGIGFPNLLDGFFVLEAEEPLDVAAYYSGHAIQGDGGLRAIDVEQIAERAIPAKDWLCQSNLNINLGQPANWAIDTGGNAVAVTNPVWTGGTNANRSWMSYLANATSVARPYNYNLQFCSCSSQGGQLAANVKSDNNSTGVLNMNASLPVNVLNTANCDTDNNAGNFSGAEAACPMNSNFVGTGTGTLTITTQDLGAVTGVSVVGNITLPWGYLGACQP